MVELARRLAMAVAEGRDVPGPPIHAGIPPAATLSQGLATPKRGKRQVQPYGWHAESTNRAECQAQAHVRFFSWPSPPGDGHLQKETKHYHSAAKRKQETYS